MIFKCGIIGLPNVGKSTLFNKLTFSSVKAQNFPFCTIKANRGFLSIIDHRLVQLSIFMKIERITYGKIELIDIAGLIKGASNGEGLGNDFLCDISKVDILCHVVRCFKDPGIYHINHNINPKEDINIIHDELILFDIALCERVLYSDKKNIYHYGKNHTKILKILQKCLVYLNNRMMLYHSSLNLEEQEILKKYGFLTSKPVIYVANVDDSNNINNHYLSKLSSIAINTNIQYLSMCFVSKGIVKKCPKFLELTQLIYRVLQVKTFFTVNLKEARSWIVSKNTIAIEAANIIHSDFKKNFIRVQVLKYDDFILYEGWKKSKELGKIRTEGKNYIVEDGDILNFLI